MCWELSAKTCACVCACHYFLGVCVPLLYCFVLFLILHNGLKTTVQFIGDVIRCSVVTCAVQNSPFGAIDVKACKYLFRSKLKHRLNQQVVSLSTTTLIGQSS